MVIRRDLDNETDRQDDTPEGDAISPPDDICDRSTDKSTNQGANAEHSNNQTRSDIAKVVWHSRSCALRRVELAETLEEVWHRQETRNLTGVIAEAIAN